MSAIRIPLVCALVLLPFGCAGETQSTANSQRASQHGASGSTENNPMSGDSELEIATLGAGCYWCVEAVLQQVDGVKKLESGFMGGHVKDPSYDAVCAGTTGHAEVVQVTFDPKVLPYEHLLAWFWKLHDPTTLNRQGNDKGTQYRSAIYTHSDAQAATAKASMAAAAPDFEDPIVTEITPADTFYKAKESHQDYYRQNKSQGYCRFVIAPKLEKLKLEK